MNFPQKISTPKTTKEKTQQTLFVIGLVLSFSLLYLYSFALIEAKHSIFLQLQPFRIERYLTLYEKFLFLVVFSLELFALLSGTAVILWRIYGNRSWKTRQSTSWLIPCLVVLIYFVLVTIQFQVLRYFKDGLDMVIVRQLGGGSIWGAVHYAISESFHLFPQIIIGIIIVGALIIFLRRFGTRIANSLHLTANSSHIVERVGSWLNLKKLLLLNLFLFVISFVISLYLPVLNKNLGYSLAHHVYTAPWRYITDLDFDGYGLVPRPVDHAPFDASRHPYALEIPGNGVDENGIGGDLAHNLWHRTPIDWVEPDLSKHNVLLIVLESARADLYHAQYKGQWVMPTLRSLSGQELNLISHTAFTAPAIVSIFNGTLSRHEAAPSLIDLFNNRGYRTGVFSAQNEGFGDQDSTTGMKRAEIFYDSRSIPSDKRMHLSSSPIASTIPAQEVLSQFESWLQADHSKPFFSYINLQELHFPYSYAGIEKPLLENLISRYEIKETENDWLRNTYYNAARVIDNSIAQLVSLLKETGQFDNTVILIVGDHGEELFDFGSLGHGTNINYEQNSPIGVLINSVWVPDGDIPIGLSEVPKLIHNALVEKDHATIPFAGSVLTFSGARKPQQIGLFTIKGLSKYDFQKGIWSQQSAYGAEEKQATPDLRLVHLWESYVLSINSSP